MTESADWSKRGIVLYGGSRDGEKLDVFPASGSINLSHDVAGEEVVETYERTAEAKGGRTIFRSVERRRDLED